MVDLIDRKTDLWTVASNWFKIINEDFASRRNDDKPRTGIQVFICEPGTRNLAYFPVGSPTEAAQVFAVEKVIRMELSGTITSQDCENPEKMQFPGGLSLSINGITFQGAVSGLLSPEDVFISLMLLCFISGLSPLRVCNYIVNHGGLLPRCFDDKNYYLYKFVWSPNHETCLGGYNDEIAELISEVAQGK